MSNSALTDRFGRTVDYVRISVTDRCDFRCVYCMSEQMTFLPRSEVLSLEEIEMLAQAFVALGVKKIRLTGGEPLVRRGITHLCQRLSALEGLDELVITTNGSQLDKMAAQIREAGVKRLNISLDSLNPQLFTELTRNGRLDQVLKGIEAARQVGFEKIKLNAVILKGRNDTEVLDLVAFAIERQLDISFIEEMPLGDIGERSRHESYCSSEEVYEIIAQRYALVESSSTTAGPSRYYRLADSSTKVGFISPHSHNFCHECNRVRMTVEGRLLLCLGNEHSCDLRQLLRDPDYSPQRLQQAIIDAMDLKPEKHEFDLEAEPQIVRFMNMTGG